MDAEEAHSKAIIFKRPKVKGKRLLKEEISYWKVAR